VPLVDLEAEVIAEALAQPLERVVGDLDHPAARLADEVMVGVVGEVVHRWSVAEVNVIDHAEAGEIVEKAIDGRLVHIGLAGLDGGRELFGRGVFAVIDQGLQDRTARARHPAAVRPEQREYAFQAVSWCRS